MKMRDSRRRMSDKKCPTFCPNSKEMVTDIDLLAAKEGQNRVGKIRGKKNLICCERRCLFIQSIQEKIKHKFMGVQRGEGKIKQIQLKRQRKISFLKKRKESIQLSSRASFPSNTQMIVQPNSTEFISESWTKQSVISQELINDFMNHGSVLKDEKMLGKQFFVLQDRVLKEVSLSMPSEDMPYRRFVKESILLQNELNISQLISNFKCPHFSQPEKMCIEEDDLQSQQDNNQINLSSEEESSCKYCFGSRFILKPISLLKSGEKCLLLSPFANQRDAWKHLIFDPTIFSGINGNFDTETITEEQNTSFTLIRFILFGAMKMTFQIGSALAHLHEDLNIAHNDLKPDNFFAHQGTHSLLPGTKELFSKPPCQDDDCVAYYLGDFGFSKKVGFKTSKEGKQFFSLKRQTYLAPEILQWIAGNEVDPAQVEKPADVFALGVSLFQVLFQQNPFLNSSLEIVSWDQFWLRVQKQLRVYEKMTDINLMKELLENMLERDPSQRFNIIQVLSHPWLENIQYYLLN